MTRERIERRVRELRQELSRLHERAGSGEDCSLAIIDDINQVSTMIFEWESKLVEEVTSIG